MCIRIPKFKTFIVYKSISINILEDHLVKKKCFLYHFLKTVDYVPIKLLNIYILLIYIAKYITKVLFVSATFQDVDLPQAVNHVEKSFYSNLIIVIRILLSTTHEYVRSKGLLLN